MRNAVASLTHHFVRTALLIGVIALVGTADHARVRAQQTPSAANTGQSVTMLPDGTSLVIGGEQARGSVQIRQADGTVQTLSVSPLTPRAWHTATLLSDGSVLIVGGTDAAGNTLAAPERFVPSTQTFEALPTDGFVPRASHTATLLTDGRVLLVGGTANGVLGDAEVWDPARQVAQPLNAILTTPRTGHAATLLADGRVLISGGNAADGSVVDSSEVFDPATNEFAAADTQTAQPSALYVTFVSPADNATDVPLDSMITVRFSRPVDVRSISSTTVELSGPDGAVASILVPAEGGRLVFIRPSDPLQAGSTYRVTIGQLASADGQAITGTAWSFKTKADAKNQGNSTQTGVWTPNGADGWRMNAGSSPWQMLRPLAAPAGVTALAGQVLKLDGKPLADVTLAIDGHQATSDETGRFLLLLAGEATGRHVLNIEGASASKPGRTFGFFEAGVTIATGQTTVLPFTIWMPRLDTAHMVHIPSPTIAADTVITTPFISGLELHLPAGTVIKNKQGQIVQDLGITPIPLDRPPFPLPTDAEVPIYFTIQPGGAYVYNVNPSAPKGGQLVYPNYRHEATGIIANFMHYDPKVLDWYVYGWGTVRGTQVFPAPKTRLYSFTGAMFLTSPSPPAYAPPPGGPPPDGDPVDVSTGLLVVHKTDLYEPDVIPLVLKRTYRPADPVVRPFGIGATQDYAMYLWSAQQWQQVDLILPDGGRVHYVRTSPGTGFTDAVFEHTATPTRFYASTISWNGNGWDLRLRDGTVYVFGNVAPLQAIRDRFGNTITITHSSGQTGNVTRVTSPNGRWIAFTYDASNRVTQATDNIGRSVGYQYDASGRLWKVTDPANGVTTYTYDASNRLASITNPRNITYLTNQYDVNNRVTVQTLADTTTYQFAYTLDGNGNVTQTDVTNPRGITTRTAFNAGGYPTSMTEAVGQDLERTTTYTVDAASNYVRSVVDPLEKESDFAYDTNGNLTSVTRLAGTANATTTTFTYEPTFNQIATVTDPLGHTTTLTYDAQGHLATLTDPLSHQTSFTYNSAGQPLTVTNPASETVTLGYLDGDLTRITDPLGNVTTHFVDAAGRVVRVVDPLGRATTYLYDAMSRIATITDSVGGQTNFTYDADSNLLTLTDANSHTTTWTYDDMDRMATRSDPLTHLESYTYDEDGNLASFTDRKNQITEYSYDALDRPIVVTYADGSTNARTYDAADNVTQIADSADGTITRTYDDLSRPTSEVSPEGTVGYSYDAAGRRTTMSVSGQSEVEYAYDDADRLTSVTQGSNVVGFTYDAANRRTSLTLPNGLVSNYGYDAASHVTSLTYQLGTTTLGDVTYTYDAAGERATVGGSWSRASLPAAITAAYDSANEVASFAGASFTYDSNGSLTSDGINTFTWNARNQLAAVSGAAAASFTYDATGRRRSKSIGTTTTAFLYDGLNPVQELSGGSVSANLLTGLGVDEYFVRTTPSSVEQFSTDALHSTVALADASGSIQTEYTYQPFGAMSTSGQSTTSTFGFTGRESDTADISFYRGRYYDSKVQRFIAEDPIQFAGGTTNLHEFVDNDPVNEMDPLGTSAIQLPVPADPVPVPLFPWFPTWLSNLLGGGDPHPPGPYPGGYNRISQDAQRKCGKDCEPCKPPVGTIAYRRDETGRPHFGVPSPHWELYVMLQSAVTSDPPCKCYWQPLFKEPGGKPLFQGQGEPPSGTVPITEAAGGGRRILLAGGGL